MKCHLCKEKIEKPYWIVDMKFCESCHKAINVGSIPLLKKSINRPIDKDEYDRYMDVWNKEINELEGNSK